MQEKAAIVRALREIATLLQMKGDEHYKVRAYETGARSLESAPESVGDLIAAGRLTELPGIGKGLAARIEEMHRTGHLASLDALHAEIPPSVVQMAQVPEIGLKRATQLFQQLGVVTLDDLRTACETHRVRELRGYGPKSEERLLAAIQRYEARLGHVPIGLALELGEPLVQTLRHDPDVDRAELAGAVRRWCDTVGELDVVVGTRHPARVRETVRLQGEVEEETDERMRLKLPQGVRVDVRLAPPASFAAALHEATGSEAHLARLRRLARSQGLSLDERGLWRGDGRSRLRVTQEEDIYRHLGLPFIPPELREDDGEIDAAIEGIFPRDFVEVADLRGMVHCHTTYSDGKNSIEEMARAAEAMGFEYITITDHSPTAFYAGGVQVDRLMRQWDEIATVQERVGIRILRGTECDILQDGALDYPDEILRQLDVVIASIHNRYRLDEEQMTERLVRAMEWPVFKIWGHGLGRLIGQRDPIACRVEEVLDAVARSSAAIEVNGDPARLDLEARWIKRALVRGIPFVLSTDAHTVEGLRNLRYAVGTARRGGMRRRHVLNALPVDEFLERVRPASGRPAEPARRVPPPGGQAELPF